MRSFYSHYRERGPLPGPDEEFVRLLAESPLRPWRPGDPVATPGTRLLIGFATWSGYDMRLLDVVAEFLLLCPAEDLTVDVFDTDACRTQEDFTRYIPGLDNVLQMPVVGIWRDGVLIDKGQGFAGRDLAARLVGSSAAEVVAFVQQGREATAAAFGGK